MKALAPTVDLREPLPLAYQEYLSELWLRRSKIGASLTFAAIPTGLVLDWNLFEEHFLTFLSIRALTELLLAAVLILLNRPLEKRWVKPLSYGWMFLAVGHIGAMMAIQDGITSAYYIGLVLVVMGTCLLLPWNVRECALGYGLVVLVFGISSGIWWVRKGSPARGDIAVNNAFFMLLFPTIGLVSCGATEGFRFREFKLRYDLDQKKKELEASYIKLREVDKAKTTFFSNISHELRTPLTLILSPLDQLRATMSGSAPANVVETLDLMFSSGLRLLSLINDLLDLVKLEEGQMTLNMISVDIRELLSGMVSSMRGAAERAGLKLEIGFGDSGALLVDGDKDRLEKVFINLLFNAIKFTPAGGVIRARAHREEEWIVAEVEDSGIGIAEEKLAAVFTRFWQEDSSTTRTRQGTGIGLALVKDLVELHKGKVEVRSKKGEGTTFTLRLPVSKQVSQPAAAPSSDQRWIEDLFRKAQQAPLEFTPPPAAPDQPKSRSVYRHTLLIVEDDPAMQRFLMLELKEQYNVIVGSDGLAGYDLAQEHQPKLIVTDLMLPKLDGISLCRKLKASPTLLPTKIVLLTARADDQSKLAALEAGADDFLTKPFSTVELKTRLANLLLTAQLERELQHQNQTLEDTLRRLQATEAQLIQSERLSALGNLSAGIMHEINNPVNFMMTAMHFLRSTVPQASSDAIETMDDIEGGLRRVRDIIADLKSFAYGRETSALQECQAEKILRTTKRLLSTQLKKDIEYQETVSKDATFVGNENQLVQLLVNLLQNAVHATEQNAAKGKPRKIRVQMEPQGNDFILSVWDNGVGIRKENLPKLFDPFFTTKPVGQGMGLGLSISHTIVKQHHGEISVKSEVGEFAEFTVRIPRTQPRQEEASAAPPDMVVGKR